MSSDDRQRIDAALDGALDQPAEQREAWLLARFPEDPGLRAEVKALLATLDHRGILEQPVVPPGEPSMRMIGPYRVLRELGRGGMGVVYLVERDDGQYRRRVAIKILRPSPDAEELHRRFLAERQILASLDHPNIALLLDGGVTEGQLPYLVMEYVEGLPITTYCDRHRLGIRARLRLFLEVCAAVRHAHYNLVVHRDLKPGNILVTEDGRVKLLDFGIAKLLNPGLAAVAQPVTRTEFRMMTPEYASPEQVQGEPLSTASDVYALGVILYELLVGVRPYRITSGTPAELATLVCEREPERPSARAIRPATGDGVREVPSAECAAMRGVTPERLRRQLRGDVDAIVMMALRKAPRQRYGSAGMLAQDLERFLAGEPVEAHRGSRFYRAQRFVARHRATVLTAAMVTISLMGGTVAAVWQARTAGVERDRARNALRESEEVTGFLMKLFQGTDPEERLGDTVTARDLLERGTERIDELDDQPLVQARLLEVLARVHSNMDNVPEARRLIAQAVALRRAQLGDRHPEVATALYYQADIERNGRSYLLADSLARQALAIRREALGPRDTAVATSLMQLAGLAVYLSDLPASEQMARDAMAIMRERLGSNDPGIARSLELLAAVLRRRGAIPEAESLYRESIALRLAHRTRHDPGATFTLLRLADLLRDDRDRPEESEVVSREAIEVARADLGPDHPQLAYAMSDLALRLADRGAFQEASGLSTAALEMLTRIYGPAHNAVVRMAGTRAGILALQGKREVAESIWRTEADFFLAKVGMDAALPALERIATLWADEGRFRQADSLMSVVLDYQVTTIGPRHPLTAITMGIIAGIRMQAGDYATAEPLLLQGLEVARRDRSDAHMDVRRFHRQLAELYARTGRPADAARHRELARAP